LPPAGVVASAPSATLAIDTVAVSSSVMFTDAELGVPTVTLARLAPVNVRVTVSMGSTTSSLSTSTTIVADEAPAGMVALPLKAV